MSGSDRLFSIQLLILIGQFRETYQVGPSLRECAAQLHCSKTRISKVTLLLADEGFIHYHPFQRRGLHLSETGQIRYQCEPFRFERIMKHESPLTRSKLRQYGREGAKVKHLIHPMHDTREAGRKGAQVTWSRYYQRLHKKVQEEIPHDRENEHYRRDP